MIKRIKYDYMGLIGLSRQTFKVNGIDIRVYLDTENFKFELVSEDGIAVFKGGNSKRGNLHVLKRQVKKALEDFGVEFETEQRNVKPRRASEQKNKAKR